MISELMNFMNKITKNQRFFVIFFMRFIKLTDYYGIFFHSILNCFSNILFNYGFILENSLKIEYNMPYLATKNN